MTAPMLERLLKYPHAAVFDPSPAPELALRVRNPVGLVWTIADRALRLVVGQDAEWDGVIEWNGNYDFGLTSREYSLDDKTVGELIEALRADGHDVVFENPEMAGLGASVLISGSGNQYTSNGDHLNGYTSLLWVMLDAYAGELADAQHQSGQALRQMVMPQAEAEWLDVWGSIYGVPRLGSETDAALQARIPQEVFRLRVNGLAIEQAIGDVAGQTVAVDEPWKRMFLLDVSALSGAHHMQDGRYYTYHVIQPVGAEGTDWSKAYPVIEHNKAAGIEIYPPRIDFGGWHVNVQPPVEYRLEGARTDVRGLGLLSVNDWVLGILTLDESAPSINHLLSQHWWHVVGMEPQVPYSGFYRYDGTLSYGSVLEARFIGLQTDQVIQPRRNIAMASVCLSDGAALGDENAILSRGAVRVEFDPEPIPSDEMMLSNYTATTTVELVERVVIVENRADAASSFTASGELGHIDTTAHVSNEAYQLRFWGNANSTANGTADYDGTLAYSGLTSETATPTYWDSQRWIPEWRVAGLTITETTF